MPGASKRLSFISTYTAKATAKPIHAPREKVKSRLPIIASAAQPKTAFITLFFSPKASPSDIGAPKVSSDPNIFGLVSIE